MTNPVVVQRHEVRSFDEDPRVVVREALMFWCPGCDKVHRIIYWQAEGQTGPVWGWNKNLEKPTIEPSILVTWTWGEDQIHNACHSFLRDGKWQFLEDSTHSLAGQTVPMVPVPDWLVKE